MKPLAIGALGALLLAGCTEQGRIDLDREAGSLPAGSSFGTSVIDNAIVQIDPELARINIQNRFAAEVDSTVTFAFNSAQLDATARAILDQQANWIRQFPELRFSVYGHTDLVGSRGYNEALGRQRAEAVVAYLAAQGISRGRLEALVSFGETQPLIVTEGRERRNRRTVTEVSGFHVQAGHSCCLNGEYAAIIYRDYVASAGTVQATTGIQGADLATEN